MDENLIKRIGDEYLQADHKDGETFLHTDYNEFLSIFKTSINENYYDIQRITNGTLKVYNTAKLDGATLSRSVNGSLSSDDNTIPSSKQVKIYVDNYYNELNKKDEALSTTVSGAVSASNTAIDTANDAAFNASNALDIATQASSQASRADFNADNAMNIATELSRTKADITEMEKRALTTETGNKLSFSVDPSTYVLTIKLLDKLNNVLSTGTVDLPIESLVMNASYDDETKSITLTLQNGEKVSFSVSALVEGLVSEDTFNQSIEQLKNDLRTELTQTITDDANSSFNQNVQNKTDSFNDNSSLKISEFNNNAAQKTLDYNNNCISKTNSFNQNSTQKLTEFNDNYTSKLNSFNSNADLRMDEYNANADLRMDEYNANADLVLSSIPKNDIEGTDNTFEDGLESPLFALGGDGKSEQVVTTGKNLYDGVNQGYYLNNEVKLCGCTELDSGFAINVSQYSQLTVSTQSIQERYRVGCVDSLPTGAGVLEVPVFNGVNKDGTNDYITVDTTDYNYLIINATNLSVIQVEEGSVATEYEPYTNGIPSPSPDYEQPINSIEGNLEFADRGKNLLPYPFEETTKTENGITFTDNGDGTITVNGTATAGTFFKVFATQTNQKEIPGNYISGSVTGCNVLVAHREDSKYTSLGISTNGNSSLINKGLYDIGYVELSILQGVTLNNVIIKPMLSNEQNVDWEPYIEPNKVTFDLGQEKLRSVGDVKDELVVDLSTGDYYKVENVGEVVLDGSEDESWGLQSINEYGIANFNYTTGNNDYLVNFQVVCNLFKSQNTIITQTKNNGIFMQYGNSLYIRIEQEKVSTLEMFNQWLSTNNTIVDYPLQNPTTKKLGTLSAEDLAKLKTFKGYNNVTVNTNLGLMNIRFTYGLDIKKYVDNELLQLEQNIITNLLNIMPETVQAGIVDKEVNSLIGGI